MLRSSPQTRIFFMTIKDRVYCLTSSSILLPMSVFIAATTFRNLSSISQILEIYVTTVRCAFSLTGIIAGLLCTFVVVACPQKNLSLITLLISILSSFGALITIATTIFSTDWADKTVSLKKTIFILATILSFASALTICICLLNRFRRPNFTISDPIESIEHASCILAALFIISAFTSIIGFCLGYTVSQQLVGIRILGGGSHSGIFGLLSTTLFILAICLNRKTRVIFLSISLGLGILALVGSSVSFYTEEIEYYQSIKYIDQNAILFRKSMNLKLLLLTKHTLVLVTSIFNLVFAAPLTVLICCLLKEDLLISNNNPQYHHHDNNNHSPIRMEYNQNAYQFCNLTTPLLIDNSIHIPNHGFTHQPSPTNHYRIKQSPLTNQMMSSQHRQISQTNSIANIVGATAANHLQGQTSPQLINNSNMSHNRMVANQTCDLLQQLSCNN